MLGHFECTHGFCNIIQFGFACFGAEEEKRGGEGESDREGGRERGKNEMAALKKKKKKKLVKAVKSLPLDSCQWEA